MLYLGFVTTKLISKNIQTIPTHKIRRKQRIVAMYTILENFAKLLESMSEGTAKRHWLILGVEG